MDLQAVGGLTAFAAADEGELATALEAAAKTMSVFKATVDDVITCKINTGTWVDEATTGSFAAADGSGRTLWQMRQTYAFRQRASVPRVHR